MPNNSTRKVTMGNISALEIENAFAKARILLQGAQVVQFQSHNRAPLFWDNDDALFESPTPVRSGIPVCWPWFGDLKRNPSDVQKTFAHLHNHPAHGLARDHLWQLAESFEHENGTTVVLTLSGTDLNIPLDARLSICIGPKLTLTLTTHNPSDQALAFSQALHSYFAVGDIRKTDVSELQDCRYVDAMDNWTTKQQEGLVTFSEETDRIYLDTPDQIYINDHQASRRICLNSQGSRSSVVWNPWIDKARRMSQFPEEEYTRMLCVETANAHEDVVYLEAGAHHTLSLSLHDEAL